MKAFIFGNFDDKKAFRVLGDDDIVKVSNCVDVKTDLKGAERTELSRIAWGNLLGFSAVNDNSISK